MAAEDKVVLVKARRSLTGTLIMLALVLALALGLVFTGWFLAQQAGSGATAVVRADVAELRQDVATASEQLETRLNARLDRIEGKLDTLIRIATAVPPDLKPAD